MREILSTATATGFAVLSCFVVFLGTAAARDGARFAPSECEFAVIFPSEPSIEAAADTSQRKTVVARLDAATFTLAASCTTGYPPGALSQMSDDSVRGFVEGLAGRIGLVQPQFRLTRDALGRRVDVVGHVPDPPSMIRAQIRYGVTSRLILQITTYDPAKSETELNTIMESLTVNRAK